MRGVPLPPLARASSRLGAGAVRLSRFESSVAVCELAAWRARRAARCVGCVEWEPRNGRVPAVAAIDRNTCVTVLAARWGEVVGVTVCCALMQVVQNNGINGTLFDRKPTLS